MTTPTVSIVIAVLNAVDDLRVTLASIERQGGPALDRAQVIVIDGGSTDGTVDAARNSTVVDVLVSEPDDGIYDAMNHGAALADGSWLHFLNAGDGFAAGDSLQVVLDGLASADAEAASWLVAGARYVGGGVDGRPIPSVPHVWWRHALGLQPHCHQATWFRRDLFVALGGYSLTHGFAADFDLILRWGATRTPQEVPRIVIDYQSGGLSDQRAGEVPALIRRIRRERLALSGPALAGDRAVDALLRSLMAGRRTGWRARAAAGAVRRRLAGPVPVRAARGGQA